MPRTGRGGDRLDQQPGDEQRGQGHQPGQQGAADGAAQVGELGEAMGAGEMQEVHAEQRAEKDDETFEAPVDSGRMPAHGDDTGGEDRDRVQARHERADDRLRYGAALSGTRRA